MATGSYSGAQYIGTAVESISNAPGLVCISEQTFTSVTQINLYDIFSREYTSYQIHYRWTTGGPPNYVNMVFLSNNTQISGTYRYVSEYMAYNGGTVGSAVGAATNIIPIGFVTSSTVRNTGVVNIENPFTAFNTEVQFIHDASGTYMMHGAGSVESTAYVTGLRIVHGSGSSLTGSVHIYGYRRDAIEG